MKLGYAEMLLIFAGVISFHSLTWALSLAGLSILTAFCRFALQVQEKKEARQSADEATRVLSEQAEELGKSLGELFSKASSSPSKKKSKTDPNLH